jgi:hypothetical protein
MQFSTQRKIRGLLNSEINTIIRVGLKTKTGVQDFGDGGN